MWEERKGSWNGWEIQAVSETWWLTALGSEWDAGFRMSSIWLSAPSWLAVHRNVLKNIRDIQSSTRYRHSHCTQVSLPSAFPTWNNSQLLLHRIFLFIMHWHSSPFWSNLAETSHWANYLNLLMIITWDRAFFFFILYLFIIFCIEKVINHIS